ncbi:DEAD/DEAH box helicase family protein [Pontibacter russatus]|uniref:hypothetical protein n=1 Tax=Pontibacter russatus TaxID=2694929 RepID=UPI00137B0BD4|nr:hypothetical protein [Pontibacter russatus]
MIHSDHSMTGIDIVVFDKFHEHSSHADVVMDMRREAQRMLHTDLRIMVMLTTLDMLNS